MIGSTTDAQIAFSFSLPTRIRFGRGMRTSVGAVAAAAGRGPCSSRADRSIATPRRRTCSTALAEAGVEVVDRVVVSGEPDDPRPRPRPTPRRRWTSRSIVAVGGGSVLDLVKAAALRPSRERLDSLLGGERVETGGLPVIALPTTAGSGAEVSHAAIVFHRASSRKRGRARTGRRRARCAGRSGPHGRGAAAVVAGSGFDAIAHAVETSASRAASDLVIHLAGTALPRPARRGAARVPIARRRRRAHRGRVRRHAHGREPRELDDVPPAQAAVPDRGTDRDQPRRWGSRR